MTAARAGPDACATSLIEATWKRGQRAAHDARRPHRLRRSRGRTGPPWSVTIRAPDAVTAPTRPGRRERAGDRGAPPLTGAGTAHLLAVMALAAAVLVVLWIDVSTGSGFALTDRRLSADVVAQRPSGLTRVAVVLSDVGSPGVMILVTGLAAIVAARRLRRVAPLIATTAGLMTLGAVDIGVKDLVARPRPPMTGWAMSTHGFSFPSGHALFSLGALLLCAVLVRWSGCWGDDVVGGAHRWGRVWASVGATGVAGVGVSRVVVGVHYPGDVLAGWSLAVVVVGATALVVQVWTVRAPSHGDAASPVDAHEDAA